MTAGFQLMELIEKWSICPDGKQGPSKVEHTSNLNGVSIYLENFNFLFKEEAFFHPKLQSLLTISVGKKH